MEVLCLQTKAALFEKKQRLILRLINFKYKSQKYRKIFVTSVYREPVSQKSNGSTKS